MTWITKSAGIVAIIALLGVLIPSYILSGKVYCQSLPCINPRIYVSLTKIWKDSTHDGALDDFQMSFN